MALASLLRASSRTVALVELPLISGSPNSGNSLPLQLEVELGSFLSIPAFLALSRLGSAPNSFPGASLTQLPNAARAASSATQLRLSLRNSLFSGIVHFGALSSQVGTELGQ